ncbi:uncharacterized protein SPPG_06050 [Spizellomyces punctatus DAOM BR117]|uniref:Uncharacterized protein n=1 Tax=Spizellomyces punctatus (strain DAOM BR117) TaxID=645134 RepID=A0A0L0HAW5_SPIPD|nr:uncharacterized protein SPPG_06050 [Spizellomyces punctatus DAOM BR117]KNC98342.1 hypothetical protein SPPG_06050 [Spizellomyces punctatus DAOM BR117]|eukprot:XP_016606382.1 hypothetical protein SPPG_06050 [Spizellomyces punctatus DAOM BR117]
MENAARLGWHDFLRFCSKQGFSLDVCKFDNDKHGGALYVAAVTGRYDTVKFIFDQNVSVVDPNHALAGAAVGRSLEIAKFAIEHGAQVDSFLDIDHMYCRSPLQLAARYSHIRLVEALIEKWGADVHLGPGPPLRHMEMTNWTDQALVEAAMHGHGVVTTYLLEKGAVVNRSYAGHVAFHTFSSEREPKLTALAGAAEAGHTDVIRILLAAGVRVDEYNEWALREAARCGRAEAVSILLDAGADVEPTTIPQHKPLTLACTSANIEVVCSIRQRGAKVTYASLGMAIRGGREVVEALLNSGDHPFFMSELYREPLNEDIKQGPMFLIPEGYPLRKAVSSRRPDLLPLLLHKYKADICWKGHRRWVLLWS